MNEHYRYEKIKEFVDHGGNKKRIAVVLGCTLRHVDRMISCYKADGKEYFSHKNKGRIPVHTISEKTKKTIVELYQTKYYNSNFVHFSELLLEHEKIIISESCLRLVLNKANLLSPRAWRRTKKHMKEKLSEQKEKLSEQKEKSASQKEKDKLQAKIVDIVDAHSRKSRHIYFGEEVQMDASQYPWFGNLKTHLHAAIDDATGNIVGAYFCKQETLNGYYNVSHQILTNYGIPFSFRVDRRTVFEYKKLNNPSIENDTFTQFGYACKQLGIELVANSVPQAKARIERLFETLQSRLPVELRLAGVTKIEEANEFLKHYLKKFNDLFALPVKDNKSVFVMQEDKDKIPLYLSVLTERVFDSGHCLRFKNKYYGTLNNNGMRVHFYKGTKALLIETFDSQLFASVGESLFALDQVLQYQIKSKNFDEEAPKTKTATPYIPPMNHPWRSTEFWRHIKAQEYYLNKYYSA